MRFVLAALLLSAATLAMAGEVTTLPSGVKIVTLREGTGATPTAYSTVKVNYRGTLLNGTEFDSSYKRNSPLQFNLQNVIPCWTQGLQQMQVGGKLWLGCPADMAYGAKGSPGTIPPDSPLIFEIELLAIPG